MVFNRFRLAGAVEIGIRYHLAVLFKR